MEQEIFQVDAFTATPFTGNPAAVCILDVPAEGQWMQQVAAEMNLSETAFLVEREDGFDLRWFTPTVEVDLCGHATLASAHILWQTGRLRLDAEARFHTLSGLLTAKWRENVVELNFPVETVKPSAAPGRLLDALQVTPRFVGKGRHSYLIEVEAEEIVRQLKPDFDLMTQVDAGGVMVTSVADTPGYDFVSRFFAPRMGINEDPVTGSAHCCLGPFWAARLGKIEMVAYQASSRGGVVGVRIAGDRAHLRGEAITVMRGKLAEKVMERAVPSR
jgi:PhzF family phenazine biosynthesis protein